MSPNPSLRARVRERLVEVCCAFPSSATTPIHIVVLSALAEGADRLVVQEVFGALPHARPQLHAVLPMAADEYAEDFHTQTSRDDFYDLLGSAAFRTEPPGNATREEAYEQAGRFVVDRSDVVIALWDGRSSTRRGGTAATVEYARERGIPVLVVASRRAGGPDPIPGAEPSSPLAVVHADTLKAYARITELNRRQIGDHRLARRLAREEARLNAAAENSGDQGPYASVLTWALPCLVRADALAMAYQRWYHRLGISLYLLAALAVTAVAAQWQADLTPRFALLEVLCMLSVLTILWVARRARLHERWLGYRSLAEALRSSIFRRW